MYSAQSLTWKSTEVSQTTPLYYVGIMRDVLVHFSDLFVDTSTQLLTQLRILMISLLEPTCGTGDNPLSIEHLQNYYADIMRD